MEPLSTVFGRRLRVLRKLRGMTQAKFGEAAGIDYKHIGAIERGEKVPSFEAIERIAKALKVDYYELFLPGRTVKPKLDQTLGALVRDISRHGSPAVKQFVVETLAAAQALANDTKP